MECMDQPKGAAGSRFDRHQTQIGITSSSVALLYYVPDHHLIHDAVL